MDFSIHPLQGVGEIQFGMARSEVRQRVGETFRSFKRTQNASFPCDYFEKIGTFCYYDGEEKLEAVEMASPARPEINAVKPLEMDFDAATNALSLLDDQIEKEADGAIAYQVGVSLYAPLAKDDPKAPVESVLAFRSGYYD